MTKFLSCAAAVGLLVASTSAFAGGRGFGGPPGASLNSPGHLFVTNGVQTQGPTQGFPGASGYAPGRLYTEGAQAPSTASTANSPGASVYAPGFLK